MTIEKLTAATPAALADINILLKQLRKDDSNALVSVESPMDDLDAVLASDQHDLLVVKDGEKIIGMATLYTMQKLGKRSGHVEDVVVDSAYRGQGLGVKLMMEVIARAREKGIQNLYLTSRPARVAAHGLYQKVGFKKKETQVFKLEL